MEEVVHNIKSERKQSSKSTFGVRTKEYLFVASVPGQVLRYCQAFPIKATEAWGEFHERAFQFFGGDT